MRESCWKSWKISCQFEITSWTKCSNKGKVTLSTGSLCQILSELVFHQIEKSLEIQQQNLQTKNFVVAKLYVKERSVKTGCLISSGEGLKKSWICHLSSQNFQDGKPPCQQNCMPCDLEGLKEIVENWIQVSNSKIRESWTELCHTWTFFVVELCNFFFGLAEQCHRFSNFLFNSPHPKKI